MLFFLLLLDASISVWAPWLLLKGDVAGEALLGDLFDPLKLVLVPESTEDSDSLSADFLPSLMLPLLFGTLFLGALFTLALSDDNGVGKAIFDGRMFLTGGGTLHPTFLVLTVPVSLFLLSSSLSEQLSPSLSSWSSQHEQEQ
jgi:hypothetical protein